MNQSRWEKQRSGQRNDMNTQVVIRMFVRGPDPPYCPLMAESVRRKEPVDRLELNWELQVWTVKWLTRPLLKELSDRKSPIEPLFLTRRVRAIVFTTGPFVPFSAPDFLLTTSSRSGSVQ